MSRPPPAAPRRPAFADALQRLISAVSAGLAAAAVACAPAAPSAPGPAAVEAAEAASAALARDELAPVAPAAAALAQAAAAAGMPEVAAAAAALEAAPDLPAARRALGDVHRALAPRVAADPALRAGRTAYTCPMADGGSALWLQSAGPMANPYMGTAMLQCGSVTPWDAVPAALAAAAAPASVASADPHAGHLHAPAAGTPAAYTCPMHPSVSQPGPGACPLCGMDLVPVSAEALASGEVRIEPARRQALGLRLAPVRLAPLAAPVVAAAEVLVDQGREWALEARAEGWIVRAAAEAGQPVRAGQALAALQSPALLAAQLDLLRPDDPARRDAARQRLRLLGLSAGQVAAVEASGQPLDPVPLLAPHAGVLLSEDLTEGAMVRPGMTLARGADLSAVWVEVRLYPDDLARVAEGAPARVIDPATGQVQAAAVARVLPVVDPATRAGVARLRVDNPDGALRPGALLRAEIDTDPRPVLQVPRDAVLFAGPRALVFVDLGEGRLAPREVQVGPVGADAIELRGGVREGEQVVAAGVFLVAAESRLRAASGFWAPGSADGPR